MSINTVVVVGANGTMGTNVAAIFASFGEAKVYMVCRNKESALESRNRACLSVKAESIRQKMFPATYDELDNLIPESDLVFESVAEDWEIKSEVTKKIVKASNVYKNKYTIFCTGSSGLSITGLAELYPEELRSNYIGMHMFNPPYQMTLCEVTPTKYTNKRFLEGIKEYCKKILYRTVVEVKDAPAFLGNRIGFQFINEALQYAEKYKYNGGIDYIDAVLGPFTGRAMAPCRTANFVGLDVHKAIVDNLYFNTNDFAHNNFLLPGYVSELIEKGALGMKSGAGLYKTVIHSNGKKEFKVYDIESGVYRDVIKYTFPFVEAMVRHLKRGEYTQAFSILVKNQSVEAELCLKMLLKYILYAVYASKEVGSGIYSADDVMATGFNWCPPLAMADALSEVEDIQKLCEIELDKDNFQQINAGALLSGLQKSRYDYRKYVKAKR